MNIAAAAIAAHESGALTRVVFDGTSTDDDYDAIQRIRDAIGGKDADDD
jgi:hypothetical protein